jgi:hypothetical protein
VKGKWGFILLLGTIVVGASAADAQHLRSKPLIGSTAVNESGERMGSVADLILGTSGRVEYVIIQTTAGIIGTVDGMYPRARGEDGGNVGATELVAIPWRAANARTNGRQLILDISKDKFSYAPGFRDWAEFEGGAQPERARAYFGNSAPGR